MALPSALSAFMGITEPAIFGVNLRYFKPFICGCIGGACGALFASVTQLGASGTGVTGIFGILLCLNMPAQYIIMMAVSIGVSFILTWLFGYKDEETRTVESAETEKSDAPELKTESNIVYAPVEGNVIPMEEIPDEIFASGVLGEGVGIEPAKGEIVAPFDGTITTVFNTKHALGLTSSNGVELLIHVGINTVELEGEYYTSKVAGGDYVKTGQVLLTFDKEAISKAGYDVTTAVLVTNPDNYSKVCVEKTGAAAALDKIITVEK